MDTPSHPSITLSSEQRVENGVVYTDDVARQRAIAYDMLREFSAKRAAYYRDSSKINLKKLLGKDVIMFAARGVATAEEFVLEAFRACESSSEETVMGNLWQALIAAISSDTLDTGDMMTVRDGALYVCELKSQVNTTNSASFPQELRELKDKCETQRRFKRASNQQVLPAFCVLRHNKAIDEIRTYQPDERDQANRPPAEGKERRNDDPAADIAAIFFLWRFASLVKAKRAALGVVLKFLTHLLFLLFFARSCGALAFKVDDVRLFAALFIEHIQ